MDTIDKYVGKLLDKRYHISRVLGVGGMAVVFEAQDIVMNRKVAVKMLKDEIAGDEQSVRRFINESKAVSMLSHPNIVKIFDVSVKGNLKYIVMERIEGITLKSYMQKKGALSTDEVLSYSEQVLSALQHAHTKGIIHRDIKPQNILLLRNGKVKVTDFGIAKLPNAETVSIDDKAIGTVYYISPEQASGKGIDQRSDLYSVGVLMYEMASGALPFNADTPVSVALMQVNDKPKAPTELKPDIPRGLEQIILGAMEKNPDRRFQSAEQMLKYIARLKTNPNYVFKTRGASSENGENSVSIVENDMKKKNKKKNKRKQSRSMFPIILGVTIAFGFVLIASGITILNAVLKSSNENTPTTVEIPSVVGDIYGEETKKQFDSSIYKLVIDTVYDASQPENTIIKQEPEAGEKRKVLKNKQYCTVTLTISKGAEKLKVPDYTVLEYRSVQLAAEKLGFKCELRAIASETVDIGYVISTEPAARTEVEYGSTLIIYYSTGTTVKKIEVPVLTNLTPVEAYSKMNGNFKVGTVTYANSDEIPEGRIISQSISSGTLAVKGTAINFVISKGPLPITTHETEPPEDSTDDSSDPINTDPPETTAPNLNT